MEKMERNETKTPKLVPEGKEMSAFGKQEKQDQRKAAEQKEESHARSEESISVESPKADEDPLNGITMRPFDWQKHEEDITDQFDDVEETETGGLRQRTNKIFSTKIEIYGHNRNNERTCLRIEDFHPYCYFELPEIKKVKWGPTHEHIIKKWFQQRMGEGNAPLACKLVWKKRLYYFRAGKTYPMLLMSFRSETALKEAVKLCSRNIGLGAVSIKLKPRENTLSPILKLIAIRKLKYSAWLRCKDFKKPEEPISSFAHEYVVNWKSLELVPLAECSKWRTYPTILSFDIECNAQNTKAMPKVKKRFDCTFMVGATYHDTRRNFTKKYLIVLGECEPIEDVEIIKLKSEKDLLPEFCRLINHTDPDAVIGYNIFGFDYMYMTGRAAGKDQEWGSSGRFPGRKNRAVELSWESSAYGKNEFTIVYMDGRVSLDLFTLIKREYKLDKYTLDHVSTVFLKQKKSPLEPKDIFRYYRIAKDGLPRDELEAKKGKRESDIRKLLDSEKPSMPKQLVTEFKVPDAAVNDSLERLANQVLAEMDAEAKNAVKDRIMGIYEVQKPKCMAEIGKYCAQDTILPVLLFLKLHIWVALGEMSCVVNVTIMDLIIRGQQIRVISMLYIEIYAQGFVVDDRVHPDLPFAGALVIKPKKGIFNYVLLLDFASLYPSIVRAYNICYTTFVPPETRQVVSERKIELNSIEWSEYHEPKKRRKVKKTIRIRYDRQHTFVKGTCVKGLLPTILESLMNERSNVKAQLKKEKDDFEKVVLDKRQNALKISANSAYGVLGVRGGKLPLIEGGVSVTAMGRKSVKQAMDLAEKEGFDVIAGDTDSMFLHDEKREYKTGKDAIEMGKRMSESVSRHYIKPMSMEFECVYWRIIFLERKKYAGIKLDDEGNPIMDPDKMTVKGIILARRDTCKFIRCLYRQILWLLLAKSATLEEIEKFVTEQFALLIDGKIPVSELVTIITVRKSYKSASNRMAIFSEYLTSMGKQVLAGDRLEFVFKEIEDSDSLQGYHMESPELLEENKGVIDYIYLLERQFIKPTDQLLKVAFSKELDGKGPKKLPAYGWVQALKEVVAERKAKPSHIQ